MRKFINIKRFPEEFTDNPDFKEPVKTQYLGHAAGSEKLYINIDYLKPGAVSAKYHSHSRQEEFFLILEGSGKIRFDGKEYPVGKGDCIAKPAGKGLAHQFINDGDEILEILDCGLNIIEETINYPEENKILVKRQGLVFDLDDSNNKWSSDPNIST